MDATDILARLTVALERHKLDAVFESIRSRAQQLRVGRTTIRIADLADIIKMKRAADRPRDRAVLEILEKTLEAIKAARENEGAQPEDPV